MAEAIVNQMRSRQWQAYSAGTQPTGYVHPHAVRVMSEIGIDLSGARSKAADEFRKVSFDLVVTVCDAAAEECPAWLGSEPHMHLSFPDPAKAVGTLDEILDQFRAVRDAIRQQVVELLDTYPLRQT
jgi:arsenate reductase (thioredoxin)